MIGSMEIFHDKMGKWVMFLYARRCRWVTTEEIVPPVHVGEMGAVYWWQSWNFYGFGFVLWESDRDEGGRGNEKREKDGDENLPQVTKQLCSNQVIGMRLTNSWKILSDDKLSDGAKRVGCRELGYFKWWVMSDGNWVRSDKKKKKKSKQGLRF